MRAAKRNLPRVPHTLPRNPGLNDGASRGPSQGKTNFPFSQGPRARAPSHSPACPSWKERGKYPGGPVSRGVYWMIQRARPQQPRAPMEKEGESFRVASTALEKGPRHGNRKRKLLLSRRMFTDAWSCVSARDVASVSLTIRSAAKTFLLSEYRFPLLQSKVRSHPHRLYRRLFPGYFDVAPRKWENDRRWETSGGSRN